LAIPLGCATRESSTPDALQPDIVLVTETVDLGRTVRGGILSGTIRIRASASGARIVRVDPSCGCTTVDVRLPVELPPLATLDIPVTTDLARVASGGARSPGEGGTNVVERQVLIESAAHHQVTAAVRVEVSDRFTLEPPRIDFERLAPGGRGAASVVLAPLEGVPSPTIIGITSTDPELTAVEAPLADGRRRIDVSLAAPAKMGPLRAEIRLRTDDLREPEVVLAVLARIEPILAFEPTSVEQLGASTTRPVTVSIRFRRLDGADLLLRSATTGNHRVRLTFGSEPVGPGASLDVVVPVLPAPAEIRTTLAVETNVPGQEHLEIPIHVAAAPRAGG
jgi:hypothetical protein